MTKQVYTVSIETERGDTMERDQRWVKFRWYLHKFLVLLLVLLSGALAVFCLFFVNRFYLLVEPSDGTQITVPFGEEFVPPEVQTRLAGTYFLKQGIRVEADVAVHGNVDVSRTGEYTLELSADYWIFSGSGSCQVTVVDETPPEITLQYLPNHYTIPGEKYEEEGFSAFDNYDGDISDRVEVVEENGTVTYSVSDSSGNRTQVSRQILYKDTVPPEITLEGGETIHLDAATSFADPGFTAWDNVDGDLTETVQVTGEVNIYAAATYVLTYTVTDAEGNVGTAERTVIVDRAVRAETVKPEGKTIYLTFDDGPGIYTRELLDILKKYHVKATFFVVETDCAELMKDIVEEGHAIGIHSIHHDYREIYASEEAFFADLFGMQQIIYERTGVMTYLMRFPGGSSNTVSKFNKKIMTRLTKAVEDAGFYYFDWNVDSDDAGGARKAKHVFENVTEGVQKRRISIVLQHDIKDFSVEAVEDIICWGLENGYTFLPLDETSPGAHHGVNN